MKRDRLLLGVCGGIAAYKAADIASQLIKKGIDIRVIMTKNAVNFVSPLTFESLTHAPVATDMFAEKTDWEIEHISLAQSAGAVLVAPATANFIGKLAAGIADDMLTTTIMATKAPVIIAPAMNSAMYDNPIVQANIEKLKGLGYLFIEPAYGRLACGDEGLGKLADVQDILAATEYYINRTKQLEGLKVLVTAGSTIEPIDPVRYMTNRSSGKMGYAFAKKAAERSAQVTLISGPTQLKTPYGVKNVNIQTNDQLFEEITKYSDFDILIMAAAPSDFRIAEYSKFKLKKNQGLHMDFVLNNDILKRVGEVKTPGQTIVGFAAETHDVVENAIKKLKSKNADYIVANDVTLPGAGFGSDTNIATLIGKKGIIERFSRMHKEELAAGILDLIAHDLC